MAVVKRSTGDMSPAPKKPGKVAEEKPTEFVLAQSKSTPQTELGAYTMLIYGPEKVGKTTLAAQFPNAYFMMLEPGARYLSVYQDAYTSWARFKKGVALLEKDKRFTTVIVDPVDTCFKLCEKYVCAELGIDHPSESEWGKGWAKLRDEFTLTIQRLTNSGRGVIFISHESNREVKTRGGDKYDLIGPTMSGMARDIIVGMVDMWFHYGKIGKQRILTVSGDDHITAGHRLTGRFRSKDNEELETINMGKSAEEAHRNFMLAFNNNYVIPKVEK